MDALDKLAQLFTRFPGIGPRQAQRFVYYLLRVSPGVRRDLARAIQELGDSVHQCPQCFRFHDGSQHVCRLCSSNERDDSALMIVATDADLTAVEQSGVYRGRYFVLGGLMALTTAKRAPLREEELVHIASERAANGLRELILAFPANPEGDTTADLVRQLVSPLAHEHNLQLTMLGRGLSTGSELEYADPATIKSALEGRH